MNRDLKNTDENISSTGWRWFRRKGLSRAILFWFLALSVIPLTLVSVISYRHARSSLERLSMDTLITAADFSTEQIRSYFDRILLDLKQESENLANVGLLTKLVKAHETSGLTAKDFVNGYAWAATVDEYAVGLKNFCHNYAYMDVLLVDTAGNIIFSVAQRSDLGVNLFSGGFNHTRLAVATQNAWNSGQPVFSDYERYAPMDNAITGFLINILVNDVGQKIGLIVFSISNQRIDAMLRQNYLFKGVGHTYLVGMDGVMRSKCHFTDDRGVLNLKIDTELTRIWQNKNLNYALLGQDESPRVTIYKGPFSDKALGVCRDLDIATVHWAVIAEVDVQAAFSAAHNLGLIMTGLLLGTILLVIIISVPLTRRTFRPLLDLSSATRKIAAGDLDQNIAITTRNEIGELAESFNQMVASLKCANHKAKRENWYKSGQAELNNRMRGEMDIPELSRNVITILGKYLNAQVGAIYTVVKKDTLQLTGSYALQRTGEIAQSIHFGEDLVGQAALEQEIIQLSDLPAGNIMVGTCIGLICPSVLVATPLVFEGLCVGVIELGFMQKPGNEIISFLKQTADSIATAFRVVQGRNTLKELLEQKQLQALELKVREEELQKKNRLLKKHSGDLQESEGRLLKQQIILEEKNVALEKAKSELERKAEELVQAGKYKSQFLANMSHELRTPLNSMLILSKILADNRSNLTSKQLEYVETIYSAGSGLLNLINDILDLSKIEAGHMAIVAAPLFLEQFIVDVRNKFDVLAEEKGLDFSVDCSGLDVDVIVTDEQKLHQIITNLLANAFKFTNVGSVKLSIEPAPVTAALSQIDLSCQQAICFKVTDTGLGIEPEKQQMIFEAFLQEDGSTSRKFGGTGLGLSISLELTRLLGGEIQLQSETGKGSSFSVCLPLQTGDSNDLPAAKLSVVKETQKPPPPEQEPIEPQKFWVVEDDRNDIKPGDRTVLIIEDDPLSARLMMNFAKANGYKCLAADNGETGLQMAEDFAPSGIMLDVGLPGIDGWEVMERLKNNLKTRHIPVQFISANESQYDALTRGAIGYITKPVNMQSLKGVFGKIDRISEKTKKDLLIVMQDENQIQNIIALIGEEDLVITIAKSGSDAFALIATQQFDGIVLDPDLPDVSSQSFFEELQVITKGERIPVVVYTADEIDEEERHCLAKFVNSILVKGPRSSELLLDDTALFLHRIESNLPKEKRRIMHKLYDHETVLQNKTLLIVDDDMRNVYALTQILQDNGVCVLVGKDGKQGIEKLIEHPETDLVLMDMIMPELDGYEAIRQIRRLERYRDIPIIALTAKAMKGDRAKCMQAGASDYLAKPVDPSRLLSMLRAWMYR
ncbi:MAG: response regulator [Desulfatitalea sp.]|nr:response regulator [Desulfatitalea sp.]NNK02309.1 response regulator [Desulfatitalea sp.]